MHGLITLEDEGGPVPTAAADDAVGLATTRSAPFSCPVVRPELRRRRERSLLVGRAILDVACVSGGEAGHPSFRNLERVSVLLRFPTAKTTGPSGSTVFESAILPS